MIKIKYNGKTLNDITGFRVLSVSGRETYKSDITSKSIDGIDGATYIDRTYPAREIKVKFNIMAPTKEAYRKRYNMLNSLLTAEQAQLIFSDEVDKYFIATSAKADTNEITFFCSDPFKYSITEKAVTASTKDGVLTATINNSGSVPAVLSYEITNTAENGYIGIASQYGAMEYGCKEEDDTTTYTKNEVLAQLSNLISASNDHSVDAMHPTHGTAGTCTTKTWYGTQHLTLGTPGTVKGNRAGGMRTYTLPADSNGVKDVSNWYLYANVIFYAGLMGQTGEMSIAVLTSDNKLIAGLNWYKTDKSGNTGCFNWIVYDASKTDSDSPKGKSLCTKKYTTSHIQSENPFFYDWGHTDIMKSGADIRFFYNGSYTTFHVPEIKDLKAAKVQVAFKQYNDRSGDKLLSNFGINTLRFEKVGVEKQMDVPNRYKAGSKVFINGNTSKVYVDGMPKPEDEVLGTKYFQAPPGETEIKFYPSSWCTTAPTVKVTYRERWL